MQNVGIVFFALSFYHVYVVTNDLLYEKDVGLISLPLFDLIETMVLILFACNVYSFSQESKTILFKLTSSKPLNEKDVSSSMDKVILSTRKPNKDIKYGVVPGSAVFGG